MAAGSITELTDASVLTALFCRKYAIWVYNNTFKGYWWKRSVISIVTTHCPLVHTHCFANEYPLKEKETKANTERYYKAGRTLHTHTKKRKFVLLIDTSRAHWFSYHRLLDDDMKIAWALWHFYRGNPLSPHKLHFSISSKGSFTCIFPQTGQHIPQPLTDQSWTTGWNGK